MRIEQPTVISVYWTSDVPNNLAVGYPEGMTQERINSRFDRHQFHFMINLIKFPHTTQ